MKSFIFGNLILNLKNIDINIKNKQLLMINLKAVMLVVSILPTISDAAGNELAMSIDHVTINR
ncbi:exported protein of unknown function [Moritella yayanosii]|uniref:Uncharacterized protein n=1 Tax=Moritella yayanosii TaxID=69539 RepID=A0A330LT16_9GAMM|nr:exported protein of unknown function [Moritella yayanosii]